MIAIERAGGEETIAVSARIGMRTRVRIRYAPRMPRWLMNEDCAEDVETGTLHRIDCSILDRTHAIIVHRAGTALDNPATAPRECWTCRPAIELRLGE